MSEQNNSFENSPTEVVEAPVASETQEMPPVTPPPEAVGWASEPEPEEERKSKKGLIVAIAIVAALLVGAVIAYAAGAFSPAPAGDLNAADNAVAVNTANANANANANTNANTSAESESKAADEDEKVGEPADGQSGSSSEPSSGSSSQGGGSSASQGGSSSQSGSSSSAQRVWVVDRAAYTETIHHDAQGYQTPVVYYTACTLCGAELTDPYSHRKSVHPTADSMGWTYTSRGGEWVETSPAWDEQVYHDEVGHWEYR